MRFVYWEYDKKKRNLKRNYQDYETVRKYDKPWFLKLGAGVPKSRYKRRSCLVVMKISRWKNPDRWLKVILSRKKWKGLNQGIQEQTKTNCQDEFSGDYCLGLALYSDA